MKSDYEDLVRAFKKTKEQMRLEKINPTRLAELEPTEVHLGSVWYLNYARNAWNYSLAQRYYPDSFSFNLQGLKDFCEWERVQGSKFYIEPLPVLVVRTSSLPFCLTIMNSHRNYVSEIKKLCAETVSSGLTSISKSTLARMDNCLIAFALNSWPDDMKQIKMNKKAISSLPKGSHKNLSWVENNKYEQRNSIQPLEVAIAKLCNL